MDFQKKMKQRKVIAVSYTALGLILMLADILNGFKNTFFFSFGFALTVMGFLRLFRNRKIMQTPQTMRKQELAEKDERSRMISERAKSWTFSLSITSCGLLVILLNFLGYREEALPFAWYVCGMVVLYWICWIVLRRKY